MKKEIKLLGIIGLFFVAAFLIVAHLISTTQKANNLFDFLITNAENHHTEGKSFPSKYYEHPIHVTFFQTDSNKKEDFASITIEDVSPLLCSQILRRERPFKVDVFLNDKPVFFGSDWRCFKGMKHKMRFQFELYNYSFYGKMHEPKACLDIWDCNVKGNETCIKGYCQKTMP